jgi:single-strand DNA-binding protein
MATNINAVVITGNLTKDPEVRVIGNSNTVCDLRVAVNGREKHAGEWQERPDYFDVTVFGKQAENCGEYLRKGRAVAVEGRLRQDRWKNEADENRSAVKIIARSIHFLPSRERAEEAEPDASDFSSEERDDQIPF